MAPDQVLPPSSAPAAAAPAEGGGSVLLGNGWKQLVSGLTANQYVRLCEAQIRSKGLEPAPVDDDNLACLKATLGAVLDQFAPGLTVPWWIGLPSAAGFVYADLRISARRVAPEGEAAPAPPPNAPESPQSPAEAGPPDRPATPPPAPPRASQATPPPRNPVVAERTANRFGSIMPDRNVR